jgi:hypothetical protein
MILWICRFRIIWMFQIRNEILNNLEMGADQKDKL